MQHKNTFFPGTPTTVWTQKNHLVGWLYLFRKVYKQKKVVSRQPIFLNLKSNTMKNTVQIYAVFCVYANNLSKKIGCLTCFND